MSTELNCWLSIYERLVVEQIMEYNKHQRKWPDKWEIDLITSRAKAVATAAASQAVQIINCNQPEEKNAMQYANFRTMEEMLYVNAERAK